LSVIGPLGETILCALLLAAKLFELFPRRACRSSVEEI